MKYGKNIGAKFYEDGSVRRYPGNTCVADVTPACSAYEVMLKIRRIFEKAGLGDHYIFLPEDSYHMTVIRGLNDQVRKEGYWPECLAKDTPMDKVDDHVAAAITGAGIPDGARMKFREITASDSCVIVRLDPADEEQNTILRSFRDRAAKNIGLFLPKHETYDFHISLAYTRIIPQGDAALALEHTLQEVNKMLQAAPAFVTTPPYMAFYDDMYAFSPSRISRKGCCY